MTSSFAPPAPSATETRPRSARLGIARAAGEAPLAEFNGEPQTIGAGPRCTVRLDSPGLRPLHCVITPTDDGPVARRWAPGTTLNGSDFTEARLVAGDSLRVGEIDLRVVSLSEPVQVSGAPPLEPALETEPPTISPPDSQAAPVEPAAPAAESVADKATADAPAAPADDWVDDSVEEVARSVTVSRPAESEGAEPDARASDPAVPNHLLQPWAPAEPQPSARDTATSAVLLNPIEPTPTAPPEAPGPGPEPTPASEPDFWSVEPVEVTAEPIALEVASDSVSAWEAEFADAPAAAPSEPDAPAPGIPEVEASVEDLSAIPAVSDPVSPAEGLPVEPLAVVARERLDAGRLRARRLLKTLREERAARDATDAALTETRSQLEAALAAADAAAMELTRLVETEARLADTERELSEARGQIEELRVQASVHERVAVEPAPGPALADDTPVDEASPIAEPAHVETAESMWGDPQTPASESPVEATASPPAAEEVITTAEIEQAGMVSDQPEIEGGLWGIEQLAGSPEAASPWSEAAEPGGAAPLDSSLDDNPRGAAAEPAAETPSEQDSRAPEPEAASIAPAPGVAGDSLEHDEVVAASPPLAAFQPKPAEGSDQQVTGGAPTSFIEQYAHMLPEEDEPIAEPAPIAPVAEPIAEPVAADADEESIDDYMRKMMERLRGGAEPSAPVATTPEAAPVQVVTQPDTQTAAPEPPPEPVAPIKDLSELKREPAREVTTDMNALRQLANQSARHAIDVAATKQSREQAALRLTASAVVMGCGALAAVTASSPFALSVYGRAVGGLRRRLVRLQDPPRLPSGQPRGRDGRGGQGSAGLTRRLDRRVGELRRHRLRDAATGVERDFDLQPLRPRDRHEVVEDRVGHVLVEDAFLAVALQIEL